MCKNFEVSGIWGLLGGLHNYVPSLNFKNAISCIEGVINCALLSYLVNLHFSCNTFFFFTIYFMNLLFFYTTHLK